MKPKKIIPVGLGFNSQDEHKYIAEKVGLSVDFVLIDEIIKNPDILDQYHCMDLVGGFTMGDHLGAGQSMANRIRYSASRDKFKEKLADQNYPIMITCNSLQFSAKLDLFPVPVGTTDNAGGRHRTSFWDYEINQKNESVWLQYLKNYDGPIFGPVSHGEGRIILDDKSLQKAKDTNLIALTYTSGHICEFFESSREDEYNPNGSVGDIAGFSWDNNFALFPHLERMHHNFQRPDKNLLSREEKKQLFTPTLLLYKGAADFVKQS